MGKNYYTTGEVAKIIGISQKTVKNYCDKGLLISENTPITGYRRIPHANLESFLHAHGISLNILERQEKVKKVMVVDDEESIVKLFTTLLREIDAKLLIETAANGYEACVKAGIFIPDAIILDLHMPKADGFEVLRNIKSINATSHAEFLVCTGYATPENIAALKPYNVFKVLQKPVDIDEFIRNVKTMLGMDALQQAVQ